jgi:hypothetical protein
MDYKFDQLWGILADSGTYWVNWGLKLLTVRRECLENDMTTDYRLPTTDYRLPTTDYRLPAVNIDTPLLNGVMCN